uniref:ALA-interacting subunit n=1 Tax=Lotharella oceanica TaxID=641309 RepID=A0A7S2TZW9_9EUKA|mmetsp:Transcript_37638/g.69426  ORF Transcript_37638/g.69426 Transcript_37638/m.69426 type:complete len:331 (+) Transcript_37638:66-1058(+)
MEDPENNVPRLPHDKKWKQQQLPAWQPIATPRSTVITLLLTGSLLVIIGSVLVSSNNQITQIVERYDNRCDLGATRCNISMNINEEMENSDNPLHFSYGLTNYYQNFRRYVKSRSDWQLADVEGTLETCEPLENYDNGTTGRRTLYPCGLVANSYFNDTFRAFYCPPNSDTCELLTGNDWKSTDIAWQSDVDTKFRSRPLASDETNVGPQGFALPPVDNENFIVWMRAAGLPTFRKLYSTVDRSFQKGGTVLVEITNNYPVSSFDGTKSIILEEVNWMYGKNSFLGILYLLWGCICLISAAAFAVYQHVNPRKFGDPELIPATAREVATT